MQKWLLWQPPLFKHKKSAQYRKFICYGAEKFNYAKFYFSGQAADDDEEIESFTAENFEADVATNDEPKTETGKDEL